jgi:primosomal replication protein N
MDEVFVTNRAELCGLVAEPPSFSHESRGIRFYVCPLETCRLSGTVDRLNLVLRQSMLSDELLAPGSWLHVSGQLRSFNNRSGVGNRLILTVFVRQMQAGDGVDENHILLTGTVCKSPTLRITPMGREICDIILAVPRRYHRSDYIPVIAWGLQAQEIAALPVGTQLTVRGRLQSRVYTKIVQGQPEQRMAFEVSAADIFPV